MKRTIAALLLAVLVFVAVPPVRAGVTDILKDAAIVFGGGALVKTFATQINDFINTLTFNKGSGTRGTPRWSPLSP